MVLWSNQMQKTQPCFPVIKEKLFAGCQFKNLESSDDETLLWLDRYAGIDYIIKKPDNQMIGVAARVQWNKNWETFTIRYKLNSGTKTEFAKRVEAIDKGYFYPTLTLQAYFNDNITPIGAAIIPTIKLFDFIKWNEDKWYYQHTGNAQFIVVKWKHLYDYGIIIYNGEKLIKTVNPEIPVQLTLFN